MRRRAILLLLAMAAALVVVGGVAYAAAVDCDGEGDRDDDPGECQGTKRGDNIEGTDGPDVIMALAGGDFVIGHDGNDEIYLGKGNDRADGFHDNDTIYGGPDGDGSALGTSFADLNLEGAEESDTVYGGGGPDWIDAAANDTDGSVDSSFGEEGNDHIKADDGKVDNIDCGSGRDTVVYDVELDTVENCENETPVEPAAP